MRAKVGIFIIISLLLLAGTATAHLPDRSTIVTSDSWVVANGHNQIKITVTALNETSAPGPHTAPVKDALVLFAVDNPIYGTVTPLTDTTDNSGVAESTFTVNKTSGVVNITARINADGYTVTRYINLNIDHDTPYYAYFTHPLSGTVATDVPFNVSLTDRWGNRIDDRRGTHAIGLHVHGPAPDDCSFVGYGHDIPGLALNPNGNQSVTVRLTTKVGPNNILMDTIGSIPDKLEWIDADTTGIPFSITQEYTPSGSPPALPADGTSKFTILYSLLDRFGNPSNQQWVWVNTSVAGEEQKFQSNNLGRIWVTYGPRSSIGIINITAKTVSNTTVTISQEVEFTSTAATNMELTANPETMASRDVNPLITSNITAKVMDSMGDPVKNEIVTFSMGAVGYPGGPYNVTSLPSLTNNSAITDAYGDATVTFIPGSFSTAESTTATGNVTITATWNATPKNVLVTWKNYPYMSVKTSVKPPIIAVNDTVEVSIEMVGDGWALMKQSDVVLVTDVSGSMNSAGKLSAAKTSLKKFVQLADGKMHLSLASYGYSPVSAPPYGGPTVVSLYAQQVANSSLYPFNPYGNFWDRCLVNPQNWNYYGGYQNKQPDAKIDLDLTTNSATLNSKINSYSAVGGTNIAAGINAALLEFQTRGSPSHNWSIVIMSDGIATMAPVTKTSLESYWPMDWNTAGPGGEDQSPTAKTAAIERASVAKAQGIKIYSVGFGSIADTATLQQIASPDCYYAAADATSLTNVYAAIFEKVNEQAGVDTIMLVDYQNINVTGVTLPGAQVFSYLSHPTYSTRIGWQNGVINVTNQSADWAADHQLDFNIGTIKIGQTWNATFRLKANQSGSIDVFGANSLVSFPGGASTLRLPHTFLTVVPQLNVTSMTQGSLALENLLVTEPGEIKVTLPVMWNTTYTGNKTITEQVYYSIDNGPWVRFDELIHDYPYAPDIVSTTGYVDYAQLDVRKLPPGGYKIKVYAIASDAPDDEIFTDITRVGGQGKTYIKLEAPPFDFFEQTQASILPRYPSQKAGSFRGILPNLSATIPPY
jgi:hypothetical protein